MTRNFKLVLEFDGSGFEGWQIQPTGHRTVQGEIEAAIARVCGERVRIMGSGRTDAGVHAEGQVANVKLETELASDRLQRALNGVLPRDVAICIYLLARDEAAWINGEVIRVDGGEHISGAMR